MGGGWGVACATASVCGSPVGDCRSSLFAGVAARIAPPLLCATAENVVNIIVSISCGQPHVWSFVLVFVLLSFWQRSTKKRVLLFIFRYIGRCVGSLTNMGYSCCYVFFWGVLPNIT